MKVRIGHDERAMARSTLAIVLVGILILTGLAYGGYSLWLKDDSTEDDVDKIAEGDMVECNYIGAFTDGRVFDTSLIDVAYDNVTYPKSLQFTLRPENGYTPYSFNVGSGTTIEGWQDAVIGMTVGQTKVVKIAPDKAYGEKDPNKISVENITVEVPMYVTLDLAVFNERYEGIPAGIGGNIMRRLQLRPLRGGQARHRGRPVPGRRAVLPRRQRDDARAPVRAGPLVPPAAPCDR